MALKLQLLVFTFWGAAELGDLVRGALESIPASQYDSSFVLGLSRQQTFFKVILPQAFKRLLPPAINLITRMIKTTSLCNLIGVVELLRLVVRSPIFIASSSQPTEHFGFTELFSSCILLPASHFRIFHAGLRGAPHMSNTV